MTSREKWSQKPLPGQEGATEGKVPSSTSPPHVPVTHEGEKHPPKNLLNLWVPYPQGKLRSSEVTGRTYLHRGTPLPPCPNASLQTLPLNF